MSRSHPRPAVLLLVLAVTSATAAAAGARDSLHFGRQAWLEEIQERGIDPAEVIYPFDATPEMVEFARHAIERETDPLDRLHRLQRALFDTTEFPFNYDQRVTLTAEQAFLQRSGNCLAFTSLFVTLARSVGLPTFLVMVRRPPSVERDDTVVVVNRHVVAGYSQASRLYLFDFYQASEIPYVQTRIVDDLSASALFHTNLGGDAVRAEELEAARHHYRIAASLDPDLAAPWIGLGVASYRLGDTGRAMEAYLRALEVEPGNPSALTNMAYIFRRKGQDDEAEMALRAAGEGASSPFTLIALADVEMSQGDLREAHRYLKRARRAYRDEPEVYDALARLDLRRGKAERAERWLQRASQLRRRTVD